MTLAVADDVSDFNRVVVDVNESWWGKTKCSGVNEMIQSFMIIIDAFECVGVFLHKPFYVLDYYYYY
jgi:hypothetical protein